MRIIILGLGGDPELANDDLRGGTDAEIWAVNDWWSRYRHITPDRGVQIHANLPDQPLPGTGRWRNWRGMYRFLGANAIIAAPDPRLPEATVHDMDAIEEEFGPGMTTNSISCAMLIAMTRHAATEVAIAGVPLNRPEEHGLQAPGILRVIGTLEARGVAVSWPERARIEAANVNWSEIDDVQIWSYWRK